MRILSRLLSFGALLAASLTLFRVRSTRTALLWVPKLATSGSAPLAVLAGLLGALLGRRTGDGLSVLAGLLGTGIMGAYITRASAPHEEFDRAFGIDWRARITPAQRARLLLQRYNGLLTSSYEARWQQHVPYYTMPEGGELTCDLWQPPWDVRPSGLAVIYVHGGGWCYCTKDFRTRAFFRHLAAQGHVVMDIDYRLAPKAQFIEMLHDIKHAIAWMKTRAGDYGVNPERIVLAGGSAGAHLALLAAYTPNHPQLDPPDARIDTAVRAVVAYYPPVDIYRLFQYGEAMYDERYVIKPALTWLLKVAGLMQTGDTFISPLEMMVSLVDGRPDEVPDRYALASPLNHLGDHCPPTLLLHGQHDCLVPVEQSRVLRNALLKYGVEVALVEYANSDHGFDLTFPELSPSAQASFYDVERFLALMV